MTDEELEALLEPRHETNGLEFKGPGKRTDKAFLAKVVRAVLGMANRRQGGDVIIGVRDSPVEPDSLTDDQAKTWTYDDTAASVNEYARPSVNFKLEHKLFKGHKLVIIQVQEFAEIPILCVKDYHGDKKALPILRRGACYVRSRHKPETSEIPAEEEMRELLELAVDKGLRKFVARAQKAGMSLGDSVPPTTPSDEELYRKQREDME